MKIITLGVRVETPLGVGTVVSGRKLGRYDVEHDISSKVLSWSEDELKFYKTPFEKFKDEGFEVLEEYHHVTFTRHNGDQIIFNPHGEPGFGSNFKMKIEVAKICVEMLELLIARQQS